MEQSPNETEMLLYHVLFLARREGLFGEFFCVANAEWYLKFLQRFPGIAKEDAIYTKEYKSFGTPMVELSVLEKTVEDHKKRLRHSSTGD